MFDRLILLALTPITLAGGAIGWTSLSKTAPTAETITTGYATGFDMVDTTANSSVGSNRLVRHHDGLFHASVLLNGRPVQMIIDTGASKSILSRADAEAISDLRISRRTMGTMQTLGGNRRYKTATVESAKVGSRDVGAVEFAMLDSPASISVIGQDVLGQLGPIILNGDNLTLP